MNRAAGTLTLSQRGIPKTVSKLGRRVRDRGEIRAGDEVRATIKEVLTVYVAPLTGGPDAAARSRYPEARVLAVDPSYRVLTVQYPSGATETFKIGLHTQMRGMKPGESVEIRSVEVTRLRLRRHSNQENSRAAPSAVPAR